VSFSFGTTGSNIVIDNCESVVEVMISVIYSLIQLLSNLTFTIVKNAQKWKVSPKTLMWSNTPAEEMRKILELII
jgi:hypothetical protein